MPAQPGDDAGALSDEVFTMVDQQPDLPLDAIEERAISVAEPAGPS
jgi:hypothetical protein